MPVERPGGLRRRWILHLYRTGPFGQGHPQGLETEEQLAFWLHRCRQFVSPLPPKSATSR